MVLRIRFPILLLTGCAVLLLGYTALGVGGIKSALRYESPLQMMIIDAGHGGADGGAVGVNGVLESNLNLAIALKMNSIAHLYGITTAMTRYSSEIHYPNDADTIAKMKISDQNERLRLIQDCPHGILISIHQNFFPSPSPSGIQVFYGHNASSKEFGELLQGQFTEYLCPENNRVAVEIDEKIYLMRHCNNTAVLVECGFLSNPYEVELLQSEAYQQKLAAVIVGTYIMYTLNL